MSTTSAAAAARLAPENAAAADALVRGVTQSASAVKSGGHEHPVVLGLGEGVERGERFEHAPLGVSVPAPEPLDCAFDAVGVDELATPRARSDRDRRKPERFERPGNARGVVVEDLTGEVVGEG